MEQSAEAQIWPRLLASRHTAMVGQVIGRPPAEMSASMVLLRVTCAGPISTLGPLGQAQQEVERILGGPGPLMDQARQRVLTGLRRRLLGDIPSASVEANLVDSCNRLVADSSRQYALVFEALDAADDATLEHLCRIIQRRGWLQIPLLLQFRKMPESGPGVRVVEILRAVEGEQSVIEQAGEQPSERPAFHWRALPTHVLRVVRVGAVVGTSFEAELVADMLDEPTSLVYDMLQQAADLGVPLEDRGNGRFVLAEEFRDSLLASLLPSVAASWHRRLGLLLAGEGAAQTQPLSPQMLGIEVGGGAHEGAVHDEVDDDSGMITKPILQPELEVPKDTPSGFRPDVFDAPEARPERPDIDTAAIAETMPHPQRTAGGAGAAPVPDTIAPADLAGELPLAPPPLKSPGLARSDAGARAPYWSRAGQDPRVAGEMPSPQATAGPTGLDVYGSVPSSHESMFGPLAVPAPGEGPRSGAMPTVSAPAGQEPISELEGDGAPSDDSRGDVARASRGEGSRADAARIDPARAADHFSAAGDSETAAERFMAAAGRAAAAGSFGQAMEHVKRALLLIERLPPTPQRRLFRIRTLIALGRLQWQAVDPQAEHTGAFTLSSAMETADAALASLSETDDPPQLVADACVLAASVGYDIGDKESLERALHELVRASKLLLSAGDSVGAARLLNDQAAVYVRLGDPVRASHLLSESKRIFESRADSDPVTMTELAETHHLLARLPFHARIRPGHEEEAMAMSGEHGRMAERWYRRLGGSRELARVWETMGRISLRQGLSDEATDHLSKALQVQSRIGDITGLARSTAALSEVLSARGLMRNALMLLGDSIALNLEKGSPIGLAFNRRAFDKLRENMKEPQADEVLEAVQEVGERLDTAESMLGRASLMEEHEL